jgi:hypothetical protein
VQTSGKSILLDSCHGRYIAHHRTLRGFLVPVAPIVYIAPTQAHIVLRMHMDNLSIVPMGDVVIEYMDRMARETAKLS